MFHEKLNQLLESEEFKDWKAQHEDFFLAHAFIMQDGEWQFGFYNPEKEKMVTFICGNEIIHNKEEEVLKSKMQITKLDPDIIKIKLADALKKAKEILNENYKNQLVTKNFIIIQNVEKPIFNITFLAQNFNTINIKIDAKTGEVIHHSSQILASF